MIVTPKFRAVAISTAAIAAVFVVPVAVLGQSSGSNPSTSRLTPSTERGATAAPRTSGFPKENVDGSLADGFTERNLSTLKSLRESVKNGSTKSVIVLLDPLGGDTSQSATASATGAEFSRAQVRVVQDEASSLLRGTSSRVRQTLENFPVSVVDVDAAGLEKLAASKSVVSIREDTLMAPAGNDLRPLVGADAAAAAGWTGNGWNVAVIDSGFDTNHPSLRGHVALERCFRSCPNGTNSQSGAGSTASHCLSYFDHFIEPPFSDDCNHGTSVASIVAGGADPSKGVATGAGLVLAKVGDKYSAANPRSATLSALDWVYSVRSSYKIAAVNMSWGGPVSGSCDAEDPSFTSIFASLSAAGVVPVAAAGNESDTAAVLFPSCVTNVISVGATETNDIVASYSNSSPRIDLWAPGRTNVAELGGGTDYGAGTSYASPVVAGAAAIVRQKNPTWSAYQVESALASNGTMVTDTRNNVVRPRIQIDRALGLPQATGRPANDDFSAATTLTVSPAVTSTVRGTRETGEPDHAGVAPQRSAWWKYTPSTSGTLTLNTIGTQFDTTLAIYTGSSVGSLTLVAENDDLDPDYDSRSLLSAAVSAGVTYHIAVDTYSGKQQAIDLNWSGPAPTASRYTAITPRRLVDSRNGTGGFTSPWGQGTTRQFTAAGGSSGVPSGATAVALNVTVTDGTSNSYLTVFPAGTSRPTTSSLNFSARQTIPNAVTVRVGAGGSISVFNNAGSVHVIVDVVGYFSTTAGTLFNPTTPTRILDSRDGTGGYSSRWAGHTSRVLTVTDGDSPVPFTATAVALNVTVTDATMPSYLTVYPAGTARPNASNLNFSAGQTIPNAVVTKLNASRQIAIYNDSGAVNVIADVVGYFTADSGASFIPLDPVRVIDTRNGIGGYTGSVLGARTRTYLLADIARPLPPDAIAPVMNITVTAPTQAGYLSIKPYDGDSPHTSNLNYSAAQTISNMAITPLSLGQLDIYGSGASTQVLADLVGYFAYSS